MKIDRNDVALRIFLTMLSKEKIYGSFLHDEIEKLEGIINLSYKAARIFIDRGAREQEENSDAFQE